MADAPGPPSRPEKSTAELVKQLSDQATALVRAEVELAKVELTQKGKQVGVGAGLFGGAGVFAFYGFGVLLAAIVILLGTAIAPWLAAVIVAVVLFVIAAVAALAGKKRVQAGTPPAPQLAIDSTKTDVATTKARFQRARS